MLTQEMTSRKLRVNNGQVIPSLVVGLVLFGLVIVPAIIQTWGHEFKAAPVVHNTTEVVGNQLLTTYLLPFEIASLLLLISMVGAIVLAILSDRPEPLKTDETPVIEEDLTAELVASEPSSVLEEPKVQTQLEETVS
jgi:NAD(P)H-quinone oxidoreductase subunit 6